VACERDLEGIVAKWAQGTDRTDGRATSWLKAKHDEYSQMRDRHELFQSRLSGVSRPRALKRPDLVLRWTSLIPQQQNSSYDELRHPYA
jgi:hypothetical protein